MQSNDKRISTARIRVIGKTALVKAALVKVLRKRFSQTYFTATGNGTSYL